VSTRTPTEFTLIAAPAGFSPAAGRGTIPARMDMDAQQAKAYAEHVMPAYIDGAKTFIQLSIGAIALSVAFKEKILGNKAGFVTPMVAAAWVLLLVTTGAGALYLWVGARAVNAWETGAPMAPVSGAGVYGTMLVTFYAGSILLVLALARHLRISKSLP